MRAGQGTDVVVIGAGIAGMSAAAVLSGRCSVAVLDMEATPAHHTTGRSAAMFIPSYGPSGVRALTAASHSWFADGADTEATLMSPRDVLYIADETCVHELDTLVDRAGSAGATLDRLGADEVVDCCSAVRPDWVVGGVIDSGASDLDVAAIMEVFRRELRANGGELHLGRRVVGLARQGTGWRVDTTEGVHLADRVVNAAGAWADDVAVMAALAPVGLTPKRRTLAVSPVRAGTDMGPAFLTHAGAQFYVGREAGGVVFSPEDETPSPPCDARAEEADVALAMARVNEATTLELRSVIRAWAGLRTFSADGELVIGPDPQDASFVWCAGQGGYGIQTSPAVAAATAALVLDGKLPAALRAARVDDATLDPGRFHTAT